MSLPTTPNTVDSTVAVRRSAVSASSRSASVVVSRKLKRRMITITSKTSHRE
ncbi:hypothetical protein [Streptomyces uncialis]|uniref:hypothetical protein n=1 Tax=Streptomyces uncialis TaxID=1048205 RepID=UPI0033FF6C94